MRLRRQAVYLVSLLAAVNLLHYANRNVAFPLYEALRDRFDASNRELGLIGSVFMVPHALTAVIVGWLGDRLDRRRVMATGLVVWSLAAGFAAVAQSMGWFLAARALAGLGTAACVPVANALLCDAFPPAAKARVVSLFNLGLFLGGVVGVIAGEALGFPLALWVVGLPGFGLAVLVFTLDVPSAPIAAAESARAPLVALRALAHDAAVILGVPAMRWTVVGAILMAFAAGGYLAWFVDFLHAKGMSPSEATLLFGAALAGGLVGVLTGGVVGDRLQRQLLWGRQAAIAIGFAAAVPCAIFAIVLPTGPAFYVACCLLMFFVSWYHGPLAASVDDLAPAGRGATSQGLYIFLMHLCGTAPASFLVGLLADASDLGTALYLPTVAMAASAAVFVGTGRAVVGAARGPVLRSEQ